MKASKDISVSIPAVETGTFDVTIRGLSPLIVNNFKTKMAKIEEQRTKGGVKTKKHDVLDINKLFNEARYPMNGNGSAGDGFKANAIKLACLNVASISGVFKTSLKGTLYILPNDFDADGNGLIRILDPKTMKPQKPEISNMMGRTTTGGPVSCVRPLYWPWAAKFTVQFMSDVITPEQIINLINRAGFASGIGEMRPSAPNKPGDNGRWEVVAEKK